MINQETENLKNQFRQRLQNNFDEAKFDQDTAAGKKISLDDLDEYKKTLCDDNSGLSFRAQDRKSVV